MKKILAVLLLLLPLTISVELQAKESGEDTYSEMAQEIFGAMNIERENAGLDAFVWEEGLEDAALVRAQECTICFSHVRPDGTAWWTVCKDLDYAENLAYGFTSVHSVMDAWMNSPSHRANILDRELSACAISIILADDGKLYFAVEFGI